MPGDADERNEETGDGDADERNEEDDGETETVEEPARAAAPPPPPPPKRKHRSQSQTVPRSQGVGALPPAPLDPQSPSHPFRQSYSSEYAEQIIEELFDRLRRYPESGTIYDFDVECYSLDGQTAVRQVGRWQLATFQGDQVRTPGMILRDRIIDECHFVVSKGQPVTYDIWFGYRHGHRQHTRGKLPLGSVDDINGLRRAQWANRSGGAQGGFGAPPSAQVPAYPQGGYSAQHVPPAPAPIPQAGQPTQAGFGAAPAYDPYTESLRNDLRQAQLELAQMRGTLGEVITAFREGRAPNVAPQAAVPQVPQHPQGVREMIQNEVATALGAGIGEIKAALGIKPGQPAAAPGSKIADSLLGGVERMVTGIFNETMSQVDKTMRSKLKDSMGLGGTPEEEEPEEPAPAPEESLPYVAVPTGAAWADGRPVVQTRDRTTGGMDWGAFITNNPIIMEQGGAMALGALAGIKEMLSKIQMADGTQVVSRTPRGTVDGTPRPGAQPAAAPGMGAIPDPPAPPPAPQAPARPSANGASRPEARPGGFATH